MLNITLLHVTFMLTMIIRESLFIPYVHRGLFVDSTGTSFSSISVYIYITYVNNLKYESTKIRKKKQNHVDIIAFFAHS